MKMMIVAAVGQRQTEREETGQIKSEQDRGCQNRDPT